MIPFIVIQFRVIPFRVIQFTVRQFTVIQFRVIPFRVIQFRLIQFTVIPFRLIPFTVIPFKVIQVAYQLLVNGRETKSKRPSLPTRYEPYDPHPEALQYNILQSTMLSNIILYVELNNEHIR